MFILNNCAFQCEGGAHGGSERPRPSRPIPQRWRYLHRHRLVHHLQMEDRCWVHQRATARCRCKYSILIVLFVEFFARWPWRFCCGFVMWSLKKMYCGARSTCFFTWTRGLLYLCTEPFIKMFESPIRSCGWGFFVIGRFFLLLIATLYSLISLSAYFIRDRKCAP